MEPGKPARQDDEYERQGVCNVFLACEPLTGQRYTMVAAHRTKQEWAEFIRQLAGMHYPDAEKIVLVMDNPNTHTLAALYEVFPIADARRLSQHFEVHSTPKHASWLNMAEIELSALDRHCLSQRLASLSDGFSSLSPPGRLGAIAPRSPSIGASRLRMLRLNSSISIRQSLIDRALVHGIYRMTVDVDIVAEMK